MPGSDPSGTVPSGDSGDASGEPAPASVSFAESNLRNLGLDARASSPAKRTRAERDGFEEHMNNNGDSDGAGPSARSPKKASQHVSPMPNRFKPINEDSSKHAGSPLVDMEDVNSLQSRSEQSATISEDSAGFRAEGASSSVSTNVSSPPTSVEGESKTSAEPDYDDQFERVKDIVEKNPLQEGMKGYVVPTSWITRVQSRTTVGLQEGHPKSFREGPVGPVSTLDIAVRDAGDLKDSKGQPFIPLKSGLSPETDCVPLPEPAWKLILEWYGLAEGHPEIVRYAHDTSLDSTRENVMWELYPPICTIRKLRNNSGGLEINQMRERDAPSVRVVTGRQASFQAFLQRAKSAAGIEESTKTRVWKVVEALPTSTGQSSMPTPVSSRANSPAPSLSRPAQSLVLDLHQFAAWPETQRELIDIQDDCGTSSLFDKDLIDTIGFSEYQQLVFEEQVKDSNGNEIFIMDGLKNSAASHGVDINASKNDRLTVGDANRPRANIGATRRSPTPSGGIMTRGRSNKKKKNTGAVGLQNLGNTCYMNSALQCIRSVEELTIYFLVDEFTREINANNPIGHRGHIAKAYATLVHSLFHSANSFSPRAFKTTLGKCEPLFSGYGQQDSQEFLSFLIDGLHEDLNRVLKKPATENPDCDDERVHDPNYIQELGEEYRRIHRLRNDSVAMDLFNGFYKNTMVCPVCDKVSVTFDPFSALTLQLPVENLWQHMMIFVPLVGTPLKIDVEMSKNNNIKALKQYIGSKVQVEAERIIMIEVYQEKIYKVFEDNEIISETNITGQDVLLFYELEKPPTNWPPTPDKSRKRSLYTGYSSKSILPDMSSDEASLMAVPVINRVQDTAGHSKGRFKKWPTFVLLSREEAKDYEIILRKVLQRIDVVTTREMFAEERQGGKESDATADSESTSSDEQKVQAQSVESEDGLVDVSMTNNTKDPNRSSILTSPLSDPSYYIPAQYRNLFNMRYYGGSSEDLIPSGYAAVNESTRYDELASRIVQPAEEQEPTASEDESAANNSSESDDELHDNAEDMTRGNFGRRQSLSSTSSESLDPARDRSGGAHGRQFVSKRKPKPVDDDPDDGYLIRLGEGIILDWTPEAFDGLFGGDGNEELRGTSMLDDPPLFDDPDLQAKRERRQSRRKNGVSLDECFDESAKTEILSEDNAWYCGKCKEHRRASKTLEIWTAPDVLVVHLKRFGSHGRLRDKVDVLVDFPIDGLDMRGRVGLPEGKSLIYDLFAVDNHYGGLGGGHYTAVTKNFQDGIWYDYNDAFVSRTTPEHAVTKAAYLLFYRRRTDTKLGPPYLQELVERAYTHESRPASPSGEDQANDDSSSLNGSSTDSQQAGAGATRLQQQGRLLGPALKDGSRAGDHESALETQARSEGLDGSRVRTLTAIGPSNFDEDEGISMTDNEHDPDHPLPSYEEISADPPPILPHAQSWDFTLAGQQPSPAGSNSSNEPMAGDESDRNLDDFDMEDEGVGALVPLGQEELTHPTSPVPMAGDRDTEMRDPDSDFLDETVRTTGRRTGEFEHVASLGHDIDDSDNEPPVAEVRVDDEGA